jgi:hypothetical protein
MTCTISNNSESLCKVGDQLLVHSFMYPVDGTMSQPPYSRLVKIPSQISFPIAVPGAEDIKDPYQRCKMFTPRPRSPKTPSQRPKMPSQRRRSKKTSPKDKRRQRQQCSFTDAMVRLTCWDKPRLSWQGSLWDAMRVWSETKEVEESSSGRFLSTCS